MPSILHLKRCKQTVKFFGEKMRENLRAANEPPKASVKDLPKRASLKDLPKPPAILAISRQLPS
jgi:hypothetical protein